jgi:hypothetical protein
MTFLAVARIYEYMPKLKTKSFQKYPVRCWRTRLDIARTLLHFNTYITKQIVEEGQEFNLGPTQLLWTTKRV